MITKQKFPIIEFDDDVDAVINPDHIKVLLGDRPVIDKLVITFFKEVITNLLTEGKIQHFITISGENDLVVCKFVDADVLILHGIIGGPACGGFLDDMIGLGVTKVMFCGGGGVLDKDIPVGHLLVVQGAIRDDGFSYHYVAPSRVIFTQDDVRKTICNYLDQQQIPHFQGLVWTTDAFYRETKGRIQLRKSEGAHIVEMEQAGCIAVTQFRNVKYGAIIYAGDDVSQDVWDSRNWHNRKSIRFNLVQICKQLVQSI